MKLYSIETGNFMIDGGAMFGVIPKVMWKNKYPSDENNYCNCSMRSLLIIDGNRKILIDNGCGDKQDEKFFSHYYLNGETNLFDSLKNAGYSPDDITDVILTHLHFDHCGGGVKYNKDKSKLKLLFKNAKYYVSKEQLECAVNPNIREVAAYPKENFLPMIESGQLELIEKEGKLFENLKIKFFNGHTKGLLIPYINYKGKTIVYVSDLIPVVANISLQWVSSYDLFPLTTLKEKEDFLHDGFNNDYILFFGHDLYNECCTLQKTKKGIREKEIFTLDEFTNKQLAVGS
ncbi:MAG: MBL fold metallo-hydrolase [Bacteroidales bacterium]|nr:MBL fold metallo-hydrolase [Bacteroidales bacterium]